MSQKIPPEKGLEDLRRVANELEKVPSGREYQEHGNHSLRTMRRAFGTWVKARKKAGLEGGPSKNKAIDKEELLADLRRVADELEKTPTEEDYRQHGKYSMGPIRSKFETLADARVQAGLELGKKNGISKSEIIKDIKSVVQELEKIPSKAEYSKHGNFTAQTAYKKFGSWTAAREAAGLEGGPTKNEYVPETDVIEDLKRVAEEIDESPSQEQYNQHGEFSEGVVHARFETWNDGLEAAGLETTPKRVTTEEYIQDIQKVAEKTGHTPSQLEYRKHGEYQVFGIQERFGSWNNAVRKAGYEPNPVGSPTGERNANYKEGAEENLYYGRNWFPQRREARARDDYQCRMCGMTDYEHIEKYGRELEVHHIKPVRQFDDPRDSNKLDNLVTVCCVHHRELESRPNEIARELLNPAGSGGDGSVQITFETVASYLDG